MEHLRTLALDTSSRWASAALLFDDELVATAELTPQNQTARELAPAIARLLNEAGWNPTDMNLIAVSIGPGSFTGLRIGVTFAKTLAYATGADVLGIDTLQAIASQSANSAGDTAPPRQVEAALDAYRGQVFAARFRRSADQLERVAETRVIDVDAWLASLSPNVLVSGPILEKLGDRLPAEVAISDRALWQPQAETVGRLALAYYRAGVRHDLWTLAPRYYRASAAEEKAL